ncbi:hypothetical protein PUG42_05895 [Erwiniaceae bacterium L1_54_3]|nr:hypothetical protein [Erwiniaceae bacterium L1_54_3]
MKVKSIGFEISNENPNINVSDVLQKFIASSSRVHNYADYSRQILVSERDDYYVGLVLTYKNQKKNLKSTIDGGRFKLKVEDLKDDEKIVTFNFLCLKKSNLKGLYLYHHASCSVSSLFSNLQTISNEHIRSKNKEEIEALGKSASKEEKATVNEKYNQRLDYKIIFNQDGIEDMLAEFKKIKSASFRFSHLGFSEKPMIAMEEETQNIDVTFSIASDSRPRTDRLARKIHDAYQASRNIIKAKVVAVDYQDNERFIDILNCPTFFNEYDFDEIAEKVDGLSDDNYTTNAVVDIIIDQIENGLNKDVFK